MILSNFISLKYKELVIKNSKDLPFDIDDISSVKTFTNNILFFQINLNNFSIITNNNIPANFNINFYFKNKYWSRVKLTTNLKFFFSFNLFNIYKTHWKFILITIFNFFAVIYFLNILKNLFKYILYLNKKNKELEQIKKYKRNSNDYKLYINSNFMNYIKFNLKKKKFHPNYIFYHFLFSGWFHLNNSILTVHDLLSYGYIKNYLILLICIQFFFTSIKISYFIMISWNNKTLYLILKIRKTYLNYAFGFLYLFIIFMLFCYLHFDDLELFNNISKTFNYLISVLFADSVGANYQTLKHYNNSLTIIIVFGIFFTIIFLQLMGVLFSIGYYNMKKKLEEKKKIFFSRKKTLKKNMKKNFKKTFTEFIDDHKNTPLNDNEISNIDDIIIEESNNSEIDDSLIIDIKRFSVKDIYILFNKNFEKYIKENKFNSDISILNKKISFCLNNILMIKIIKKIIIKWYYLIETDYKLFWDYNIKFNKQLNSKILYLNYTNYYLLIKKNKLNDLFLLRIKIHYILDELKIKI